MIRQQNNTPTDHKNIQIRKRMSMFGRRIKIKKIMKNVTH